jgi:hypothetical protein
MRVDTRPQTPALWCLVAESLRIAHGRVDWLQTRVVPYGFVAGGNNSVVECDLAKVEVAGSNPVSRSILRSPLASYGWQASEPKNAKDVHRSAKVDRR